MRIDLPGCDLKSCRYYQDHSCTNKNEFNSCNYARLHTMEIEGRVRILPCKAKDTVYGLISNCEDCVKYNDSCHITCKMYSHRIISFTVDHFEIPGNYEPEIMVCSADRFKGIYGKTVFGTFKEAAEHITRGTDKNPLEIYMVLKKGLPVAFPFNDYVKACEWAIEHDIAHYTIRTMYIYQKEENRR